MEKRRNVSKVSRSAKRKLNVQGGLRVNMGKTKDIVPFEKVAKLSCTEPLLKLDSAILESIQAVFDTLNFGLVRLMFVWTLLA